MPPIPEPELSLRPATAADILAISRLAGEIWRACYPGIISEAQIEYMLARDYDPASLKQQITQDGITFALIFVNGALAGFAAYGPADTDGELMLHKLYLLPEHHGKGLGSLLIAHVVNEATTHNFQTLSLRVNKENAKAITAYQRNGFAIREAVVSDIGAGFVMDDYVMSRSLTA